MKLRYAGNTHVGMKRTHNEDNFYLLSDENLYMVADGMGGHASGEVASQIAVETMANFFRDTSRDIEITWPYKEDRHLKYEENRLGTAVKLANLRIYETAKSDWRYRGMGTTIVCMHFTSNGGFVAHVGDSRVYRVRGTSLEQITRDHSLLNDYIKAHPDLSEVEIEAFPHKNVIVRALGMKESVQVDINRVDPQVGDYYLLCTDGLSGMLPDDQIRERIVNCGGDLEKGCNDLIAGANENGGADNVTVVLIHFPAN